MRNTIHCPYCDTENPNNARCCIQCGKVIKQFLPGVAPVPMPVRPNNQDRLEYLTQLARTLTPSQLDKAITLLQMLKDGSLVLHTLKKP